MKLWEVIKELTNDPTKLFRKDSAFCVGFTTDGALGWKDENGAFKSYFTVREEHLLDDGWKPVRQPVTWQEAIEAWKSGKNIYVISGECKFEHPARIDEPDYLKIGMGELQWGKWYVEG